MKAEEEKKVKVIESKEKKQVEITTEVREQRKELSDFLKEGADELARKERERKRAREKEVVILRSGEPIPYLNYIKQGSLQDYSPQFPNDNPYFKEMYRLAGWTNWDPDDYVKPPLARLYFVETIYYRFHKEILPTLKAKAIPGKHKLFQLLTDEGLEKLRLFRDQTVEMMKTYDAGKIYEFRLEYANKYGTDVQLELIR